MKHFFLAHLVLLFVMTASFVQAQFSPAAPVVSVSKPTVLQEAEPRTYIGTVRASETVHVTPKVTGTLWKSAFKEGSLVKQGDLLFEIEDTVYKANLQSAQASLKQIEAEYDYAKKEYERNKALVDKQVISDAEFAVFAKNRDMLAAKILEQKARIRLCENDLSYTKIYSPISGRIGENFISAGNEVTPGTGKLATIVQYDPVKIRFAMAEADFYTKFKDGKIVDHVLTVRDANGNLLSGDITLDFFDNQVDSGTDTVMIQLLCPNAANAIVPGGFVKIDFTEKFATPQLAIPRTAVMNQGPELYVYVVKQDNTVERRVVVPGPQVRDMQLITSGLSETDQVISTGVHKVFPGSAVKIASSASDTPASL